MGSPVPEIAVAGNQWITQFLVHKLARAGYAPSLVINMTEDWSDRISGYVDLARDAEAVGAEVYRPSTYGLKAEEDVAALTGRPIDVLIVFGWQRLIPEWLINHVRLGVWGVHGGPEKPPRCRGRAVFNWAILLGYERFYMYMFKITPDVDSGDIVRLTEFQITPDDDICSVYHKNCIVSADMFIETLPKILDGSAMGEPQPSDGATYLPKRGPEDGGIDWTGSAARVVNLVRAVTKPYPGAFTFLDDAQVVIYRAHVFDATLSYRGEPGEIIEVFPNGDFLVMARDTAVYVRDWSASRPLDMSAGARFQQRSGRQPPDPEL